LCKTLRQQVGEVHNGVICQIGPAELDAEIWFTRYQPGQVKLVGQVIKVRGEMTLSRGNQGSVKIHTDYTFVYPFTRACHEGSELQSA
jgi:hypothetical protein